MEAVAAVRPMMQLAGVGLNTYSNVMATDVQAKALDSQARSIEANTQAEVIQQQRDARLKAGTNNATLAASGVDITRGSPLWDALDLAKQSEIQKQSIQRSGAIEANNVRFQSRMTRRQMPFQIAQGALRSANVLTKLAGPPQPGGGGRV
jgi:hypothetical protein